MALQEESFKSYKLIGLSTLFLALAFVFALPLKQSLWLDETITAWVTADSFGALLGRVHNFQGQSPLYFIIIWVLRRLIGGGELEMRSFSVLCALLATGTIFLIAKRWFGTACASASVAVFVCLNPIAVAAVSARSYAPALFFALLSVLAFDRYCESGRARWRLVATAAFVFAVYFHYLFAGIAFVYLLLWLLYRHRKHETLTLLQFVNFFVLCFVFCTPAIAHLIDLSSRSAEWSFAAKPDAIALGKAIMDPALAIILVASLVVSRIVAGKLELRALDLRELMLWSLWWLLPIAAYFLHAQLSASSLFVTRYFLWSYGGLALCVGWLASGIGNKKAQRLFLIVLLGGTLVRTVDRQWRVEPWREIAHAVQASDSTGELPVFVYAGLIESDHPEMVHGEEALQYLTVPFQVYHVAQRIVPIQSAVASRDWGKLPQSFFLVTAETKRGGVDVALELREEFTSAGYTAHECASILATGTVTCWMLSKTQPL